ncbi:MAG: TatD family hydrolase [Porphyromonadaceae bacterium]|nr:TatD family hydrolase [Porphyromonadaceae bacterium]
MPSPYIDLHSHQPSAITPEFLRLQSLRLGQSPFENHPYSLGLHPWYAEDLCQESLDRLISQVKSSSLIWAIGEAGLDKLSSIPLDIQIHYFREQIRLSERLQRPLVIHCVRAWSELLTLKRESRATQTWIVHGFRGKAQLAKQLLRAGLYLSFGEYFQPDSLRLADQAQRLFLETDEATCSIQTVYSKASARLSKPTDVLRAEIADRLARIYPEIDQFE